MEIETLAVKQTTTRCFVGNIAVTLVTRMDGRGCETLSWERNQHCNQMYCACL